MILEEYAITINRELSIGESLIIIVVELDMC